MYQLPLPGASFDAVVIHQVLHYADRPARGRSPRRRGCCGRAGSSSSSISRRTTLEFLRDEHAHRRLGFADSEIADGAARPGSMPAPPRRLPGDPLTVVIWTRAAGRRARSPGDLREDVRRRASRRGACADAADPANRAACSPPIRSSISMPARRASRSSSSRRRRRRWRSGCGRSVKRLEPLAPRFVSVTYGAGGSTRERTHATVRRIRQETALEPAAHLTCVGATRDEIDAVARRLLGGRHPPHRRPARRPARRRPALRAASRRLCLCRRSRRRAEARRRFRDQRRRLSRDPSRGAERRARSRQSEAQARCRRQPRDHPVFLRCRAVICASATARMPPASPCRSCRASCRSPISRSSETHGRPAAPRSPAWMAGHFDGLDDDPDTRRLVAASIAAEQCRRLQADGVARVPFLHAEPRRSDRRDLPHARRARATNARHSRAGRPEAAP